MNCPHCRTTLLMSERQGVEIDYCPDCRGVWLDRGELDKIIARAGTTETYREASDRPPPSGAAASAEADVDWKQLGATLKDVARTTKGGAAKPYDKKKKKSSFLEEIFNF